MREKGAATIPEKDLQSDTEISASTVAFINVECLSIFCLKARDLKYFMVVKSIAKGKENERSWFIENINKSQELIISRTKMERLQTQANVNIKGKPGKVKW